MASPQDSHNKYYIQKHFMIELDSSRFFHCILYLKRHLLDCLTNCIEKGSATSVSSQQKAVLNAFSWGPAMLEEGGTDPTTFYHLKDIPIHAMAKCLGCS